MGYIVIRSDIVGADLCVEGGLRIVGGLVPRCMLKTDSAGESVLPILNISGRDIDLKKDAIVARAERCLVGEHRREVNDAEVTREEIITDLVGDEVENVLYVDNEYTDLVARNMRQIGCTHLIEMDIKLQDEKPMYYKPYRMAHSERQKVKEIIEELREADIVEECDSPFASPVLLVKKKTGNMRMCVG